MEKITLNLVEYKSGQWGFVGHIPAPFLVTDISEGGRAYRASKMFDTEDAAVSAAMTAGFDVRVYRNKEPRPC